MPRVNLKKLKLGVEVDLPRRQSSTQASISSFFRVPDNADNHARETNKNKRPAVVVLDDETDSSDDAKEARKKQKLNDSPKTCSTEGSTCIATTTLEKLKDFEKNQNTDTTSKKHEDHSQENHLNTQLSPDNKSENVNKRLVNVDETVTLNIDQFSRRTSHNSPGHKSESKNERTANKIVNQRTKTPYTPLEVQFIDIKAKYKDAILFVECGYKYKFFGVDAEIAAKELNIMCFVDHNFMVASIPSHRLHVHVRRLVSKGYKVGVVKQTETAALKAAGGNKSNVFTRKLHALYTKATLVGEDMRMMGADEGTEEDVTMETGGSYLMCICENTMDGSSSSASKSGSNQVTYGIVAVQPSTGEIIYDEFQDTHTCSELETRLEHINPSELLIPDSLSHRTQTYINEFANQSSRQEGRIRIEHAIDKFLIEESTTKTLTEFCEESRIGPSNLKEEDNNLLLQKLLSFPNSIKKCFATLISYLKDFRLENVLRLTSNFVQFSTKTAFMKLNGCTLRNLEVFKNQSGHEQGTLLWILDHTCTPFGKRLLKKWISQPLREKREIDFRLDGVSELVARSDLPCVQTLPQLMSRLPHLQKGLCSIYYKKCSPREFLTIVNALDKLCSKLKAAKDMAVKELSSPILTRTFAEVPELLHGIESFSRMINEKAARDGDKTKLFVDPSQFPEVVKCNEEINRILLELKSHRSVVRRLLQHPSLDYCNVSGNEFLIEVKNAKLSAVPADWIKISATKQVCRFRPPFIDEQYKLLCQQREALALVCHEAWLQFLDMFCANYTKYHKAVQLVAVTDCLLSLATVAKQPGFVRPVIKEGTEASICIKQGRHPIIDALLPEHAQYVPNNTDMQTCGVRCMIITGPNMGGKSSYIKQVALICVMAQIGSYVPAEAAEIAPLDAICTRMGACDNIYKGRSTFMVELQEASEILQQATPRSLVVLDELGRGTSTHDGVAIAYATLQHFITQVRSLTLFVTHYPSLAELQNSFPGHVTNNHMAFMTSQDDVRATDDVIHKDVDTSMTAEEEVLPHDQDADIDMPSRSSIRPPAREATCSVAMETPSVTFLYELVDGAAARSYGLNVARLAGIPPEIIAVAAGKSHELELEIASRRSLRATFEEIWQATPANVNRHLNSAHKIHVSKSYLDDTSPL